MAPGALADLSEKPVVGVEAAPGGPTLGLGSSVGGAVSANASADIGSGSPGLLPYERLQEAPSTEAPTYPLDGIDAQKAAWTAALLVAIAIGAVLNPSTGGHLFLGLFSRIDRHALLTHPVRLRIHASILQQPGITMKEIARSQGIGWGTTVYHLGRLEHARLVVSQRQRQFRRFYDAHAGLRPSERNGRAELLHPTSQRIVTLVIESPGASQRVIADAVGISAAAAHKYLGRLEHAGLVARQRDAKRVRYFPTQHLVALAPLRLGPAAPSTAA